MSVASILIVHSDQQVGGRLCRCLTHTGHRVHIAGSALALGAELQGCRYDLLIAEDQLSAGEGKPLLTYTRNIRHDLSVILISGSCDVQRVVESIQMGASDYLLESADDQLICASVEKALSEGGNGSHDRAGQGQPMERPIIFCSEGIHFLLNTAARIAGSSATVLIQGESGTGKEMLARFIHNASGRASKPFVAMNCAALPDNLAESELFGYEKGAFTGAQQRRPGKFEQAHGGTLLLDEISELPLLLQSKLLRVLQEKEFDRLGGRNPVSVDVRIIATTNRDLAAMVREGGFRDDLYFRLRVIPLKIPPLRMRRDDIALLAEHFIDKYCQRDGRPPAHLDQEALEQLVRWDWPGNVRELANTIERAVLICENGLIGTRDLLLDAELTGNPRTDDAAMVGTTVKDMEKRLIEQTLSHVNQNRTYAAKMLGISIRTLRNKLKEYRDEQIQPPI